LIESFKKQRSFGGCFYFMVTGTGWTYLFPVSVFIRNPDHPDSEFFFHNLENPGNTILCKSPVSKGISPLAHIMQAPWHKSKHHDPQEQNSHNQ